MKKRTWLLMTLLLAAGTAAANTCHDACEMVATECEKSCDQTVKKKNPGQAGACRAKCKEFKNDCRDGCKREKPTGA